MKWDIRVESDRGFTINPKTGETKAESVQRVRFRKVGSRGRFRSFVIVGGLKGTPQEVVEAYLAKGETKA